jgi:cellulose synthase (UDP-forming)
MNIATLETLLDWTGWLRLPMIFIALGSGIFLVMVTILAPLDLYGQMVFFLGGYIFVRKLMPVPGRSITLVLMLVSVIASTRYLYWRLTETFPHSGMLNISLGGILLGAEIYAWLVLVLGFFQSAWPLGRKPVPCPKMWPIGLR